MTEYDRIGDCIGRGDLDAADAYLEELSATAGRGDLRVADLRQRLGDARAERKMISGATTAYLLVLRELREVGAGAVEVSRRMALAADSLCRLFRYRLPVRTMLASINEALGGMSPQKAESVRAALAAELPGDPDREVCYWHNWSPEGVQAFETAAAVYAGLIEYDAPRYRPEAARIRLELARQLQTSTDAADRSKAADLAHLAYDDFAILRRDDNAMYLPLAAEALNIACSMHWRLRRYDRLTVDAVETLALYRQMAPPADAIALERIALLTETLAWSYQHARQAPRAVQVLEDVLPLCRSVAAADPINAEPILADALHSLGLACMLSNDDVNAEKALSEAVRLARKLAAQDGPSHADLLSSVLKLYADLRSDTGRWDLAIDLETEAERWKNKKFLVS